MFTVDDNNCQVCVHFVQAELRVFINRVNRLYILKEISQYVQEFCSRQRSDFSSCWITGTVKQSDLKNEKKMEPNNSADIIHISLQVIGPAHSMTTNAV